MSRRKLFLAVQAETVEAVSKVERIAAGDGVEARVIGPSDRAISMGIDHAREGFEGTGR